MRYFTLPNDKQKKNKPKSSLQKPKSQLTLNEKKVFGAYLQNEEKSSCSSEDECTITSESGSNRPKWAKKAKLDKFAFKRDRQEDIEMTTSVHKELFPHHSKVNISEYENKLRERYNQIYPEAKWATKNSEMNSPSENLIGNKSIKMTKKMKLTNIQYEKIKNLNSSNKHKSRITSIDCFREGDIVLTSSVDQKLMIFKSDNLDNQLLHSLYMKKYPILSAQFSSTTDKIFFSSIFNNYYSFDMNKNALFCLPIKTKNKHREMLFSKLSPNGKMICFFFNTGELDIYSTQTHLPIATMAANNIVSDACFDASGDTLFTCSSKSSAVHLWDMRNQKSFAFLQDDNFYGNTSLALSPKEKLLSLGNSSGALNLYSIANPVAEFENKNIIKPTKTLSNLTYSCENIIFSPKTNLMFYSSSQGENSAKLLNCSSKTVYSNFLPIYKTLPTAAAFSNNGKNLFIGAKNGDVHTFSFNI